MARRPCSESEIAVRRLRRDRGLEALFGFRDRGPEALFGFRGLDPEALFRVRGCGQEAGGGVAGPRPGVLHPYPASHPQTRTLEGA